MQTYKLTVLILLFSLLVLTNCPGENRVPFKTVPGPESKGVANINGMLLFDRPVGGLVGVSLPSKNEIVIRAPGASTGTVHSVSGPDHNGLIAIIENHMSDDRHLLKVYQAGGKEFSTIFERKGDALWGDEVGDFLALSPVNGYVAMVVNSQGVQLHNPDAYLKYGNLEIWDINTKEKLTINQGALDHGLHWFPDGKHLAFVDMVEQNMAAAIHRETIPPQKIYAQTNLNWHRVPVVSVINVETRKVRQLFIGWSPVVANDGKEILAGDYDNNWALFSVDGTFIQSINPPGMVSLGVIYFNQNKIFYWALPTAGTEQKTTKNNSPLVGPKPLYTLKVAEIKSGKFETIIPYIDPRRDLSFGVVKQK